MFRMYFDGSLNEGWLTLGGFGAEDPEWVYFEKIWNELLQDRGGAPYMHMTDAMNFGGPFEKRNGWDEDKIDFLVQGLIGLLIEMPKKRFHAFRCTVERSAYERWRRRLQLPVAPRHCARWAFRRAYSWYGEFEDKVLLDKIDVIYDRGERFLRHIYRDWQDRKNLVKTQPWWNLINTVETADWRVTPPLQAADMLAWSANTLHSVSKNDFVERLCKDVVNGPAGWHEVLDETTLANIYHKRALSDSSLLLLPY